MSTAMQVIVEGYQRLGDLKSLDDLRGHRRRLVTNLKARSGIDCGLVIRDLEGDIAIIEAALNPPGLPTEPTGPRPEPEEGTPSLFLLADTLNFNPVAA